MSSTADSQPGYPEGRSLVALEEKISFQQRQLDDLNSVVIEQQRELGSLKRELKSLTEVVRGFVERTGDDLPHEKPPHY